MTTVSLEDVFLAYYDCRKHKRNSANALAFELDYEAECLKLHREIVSGTYRPRPSSAFIVCDPVKREIFAAGFRDRVAHHLIARKLEPHLERILIHDAYGSRLGKGTSYGIRRVSKFFRACSDNYSKEAHVLKLDVSGFFMGINRKILLGKIRTLIDRFLIPEDADAYFRLVETIVDRDVTNDCVIRGNREDWVGLPKNKSLFYCEPWYGLPIGNLTSQIFSNLYLHGLDSFVKRDLKIRYYGRYVDDFVLVHESREYLEACIPKIARFLRTELDLELHPKKISLQPVRRGVKFLGVFIKPNRRHIGNRTKGNFHACVVNIATGIGSDFRPGKAETAEILSRINSYLGLLAAHDTYKLRKKTLSLLPEAFWECFVVSGDYSCIRKRANDLENMIG